MANSTTQAPPSSLSYTTYIPGQRPDDNRGPEILATCGSLVGLALFVVCLRIWVRLSYIRKIAADDYFMMAAMVSCHFFFASCPLCLCIVYN